MSTVTVKEINSIANTVKSNVDKNKKLPSIEGWTWNKYGYVLAQAVLNPGKSLTKPSKSQVDKAPNPSGYYISRSVYKKEYTKLAKYVVNFVKENKRLPNYIQWGNYRIRCKLYIYCFAKIVKFYADNGQLPSYCNFNSNDFSTSATVNSNSVFDYFVKVFGKVSKIDEALEKINGRGYGYYYDDKYGNITAIDRIKKGYGINCTDSCQVFWHIAKVLGYEVQCLHVKCAGGDGHVRLRLRHPKYSNNQWFLRDPAAVLENNGRSVDYNWCVSGYTLLATNPNWFLANVNR